MKSSIITKRNAKEIWRDPINLVLGLAIPVFMLFLFTTINSSPNVPDVEVFKVQNLTPGIVIFGFSFLMMFSGMLLAKDRKSAFLARLFSSPLKASDYICGYLVPFIPIAILQIIVCYLVAALLGLSITANLLISLLVLIPAALFAVSLGMIIGSLLNDGQVAGFGSVFITVTQLFSGAWMDLKMVGGVFEKVGNILPFSHTLDAVRAISAGNYSQITPHLYWLFAYTIVAFIAAIFSFNHAMKR